MPRAGPWSDCFRTDPHGVAIGEEAILQIDDTIGTGINLNALPYADLI